MSDPESAARARPDHADRCPSISVVGVNRYGYNRRLIQYDEGGWRATFYTTGMEHSPTSATGTGWERTPWHATQRAAWEALDRLSRP